MAREIDAIATHLHYEPIVEMVPVTQLFKGRFGRVAIHTGLRDQLDDIFCSVQTTRDTTLTFLQVDVMRCL